VVDVETGQPLSGLAEIHYDASFNQSILVIKLVDFEVEIEGDATLKPFERT